MNHSRVALHHFQKCAASQDCIMNYLKLIVDLHVNRTMTDQMQTYTYHK